jgi:hypothetical protein
MLRRGAETCFPGGVAEWSIAAVLKTVGGASLPGVRIPPPPPITCSHLFTAAAVKAFTNAARLNGNAGLSLPINCRCYRRWIFKYTIGGKARDLFLGTASHLTLAQAGDLRDKPRFFALPIQRTRQCHVDGASAQATRFRRQRTLVILFQSHLAIVGRTQSF